MASSVFSLKNDSVFGRVESGWKLENGQLVYESVIPANCTAEICLPGQETETVGAGVYRRFEKNGVI